MPVAASVCASAPPAAAGRRRPPGCVVGTRAGSPICRPRPLPQRSSLAKLPRPWRERAAPVVLPLQAAYEVANGVFPELGERVVERRPREVHDRVPHLLGEVGRDEEGLTPLPPRVRPVVRRVLAPIPGDRSNREGNRPRSVRLVSRGARARTRGLDGGPRVVVGYDRRDWRLRSRAAPGGRARRSRVGGLGGDRPCRFGDLWPLATCWIERLRLVFRLAPTRTTQDGTERFPDTRRRGGTRAGRRPVSGRSVPGRHAPAAVGSCGTPFPAPNRRTRPSTSSVSARKSFPPGESGA